MARQSVRSRSPRAVRALLPFLVLFTATLVALTQAAEAPLLAQGSEVAPLANDLFPGCAWNCSANDVHIESVWLGDATGALISTCPEGGLIPTASVWVTLNNITGTERYYVSLKGDVQIDDGPIMSISPCLVSPLSSGGTTQALQLTHVQNVPCTAVITLSNVVIPWVTSPADDTSCAGRPAACNPSWPSGQAWCGGPYAIDVLPDATPTATAVLTATLTTTASPTNSPTAIRTNTPVNTPALTLAPQDDPTATATSVPQATVTADRTAAPTVTSQPEQPVLPATGTGSAGRMGSALSAALTVAGGVVYWLRRRSVI